ncbi:hypothetical protein MUP37_06580, partial [Candidatus Bathyarchaeota archaeon]|nr:hypothetical protein [Candidatus Bathyarchaeota archaeon]
FLTLNEIFTTTLNPPAATVDWSNFSYTGPSTGSFSPGNGPLPLKSGASIVTYFGNLYSVKLQDIGSVVGLTILTANNQYYVQCNVQLAI